MESTRKTFNVIKDFTSNGLAKGPDDLWAYASVETTDAEGDVIRVAGIDTSEFHNPPNTHMKVLARHFDFKNPILPDGTPPIIGRVEEFRKMMCMAGDAKVPALAFRMTFAKDKDGNFTKLGKAYKDLFDGGYMDSFSIGATPKEARPLRGGKEYTKSVLFEIAAPAIAANTFANAIKCIKEELGEEVVAEVAPEKKDDVLDTLKSINKKLETLNSVTKTLDAYEGRFDLLESALVAPSKAIVPAKGDPKEQQTSDEMKRAAVMLEALSKSLAAKGK